MNDPKLARAAGAKWFAAVLGVTLPSSARADPTEPGQLVNALQHPGECQFCHSHANDDASLEAPPYASYSGWQGSLMANAARDPVFWAGVAVAAQDAPEETQDCVRCHAPRAFLEGRGDATSIDELEPLDFEGVGCETCHRAVDDPEFPRGNARYTIDDQLVDGTVPRRGPWAYDDGVPSPPHSVIADPFTGSSAMCGTCHDVTTGRTRLDDDGNSLEVGFNEQRTYREWLNSSFSTPGEGFRSCQDCHMPAVDDKAGCNTYVNVHSHATGGRRHDLVGANRFMLELLRSTVGDEGTGEVPSYFFDRSIARMDELLATAATLEVAAPPEVDLTAQLSNISVTVTNNTGHKLPTGYSEGRVMWIEVLGTYEDETVYSSGLWNQRTGEFEQDPNLRRYEGIAEETSSGQTFHLLRNDHWVEDSRIPPLGLRPDIETDPVGDRYQLGEGGTWPNADTHEYTFPERPDVADRTPGSADGDVLTLRVRLLYLINTREYVEFLADENSTNDAGSDVAALFDAAGGATPVVLAEQTLQLPISQFGSSVGGSSSGDGTSSGGADGSTTADTSASDANETSDTDASSSGSDGGNADGDGGCGCSTTPSNRGAAALLLFACLAGRRRSRGSQRRR